MKNKIAYLLVFLLVISTIQSYNSYARNIKEDVSSRDYSHTVLVEVATSQNCKPCHYWSQTIHDIYDSGGYDFHFVEMIVFDDDGELLNDVVTDWYSYYDVGSVPKNIMDGDYRRVGNNSETFTEYLNECGNRAVADISASMTVLWLGDASIQVDIYIRNNEETQYNGHIRASITEIISRYNTYYNEPYHYGFLNYAFDTDIAITAGGSYTDSMTWNGNEHQDNHGNNFSDIDPENIKVIMGIFNDNDGYNDETVEASVGYNNPPNEPSNPNPTDGELEVDIDSDLSWDCSDPDGDDLTYDVYFGSTSSPPLVKSNHNSKSYNPGTLNHGTIYYWKIIARDLPGNFKSGPIWVFTTEPGLNNPPGVPTITGPSNGKPGQELTFVFNALDPEGDDIRFLIEWGDTNSDTSEYVESNSDKSILHKYDSEDTYTITAKAEDEFGLIGPERTFQVTIPRNKIVNRPLLQFLQSYPNLFPILQKILRLRF